MKLKNVARFGLAALSFPSILSANELGVGRDNDVPGAQPQPPAETETTTTESTLQQFLEIFGMDVE